MSLVKQFLAIHSNPVNVVGALMVLFGLIRGSLWTVLSGAVIWMIGFIYYRRFLAKKD